MVNKETNTYHISRDVEKSHENLHAIQKFKDLGVSRLLLGTSLIFQDMLFLHLFILPTYWQKALELHNRYFFFNNMLPFIFSVITSSWNAVF